MAAPTRIRRGGGVGDTLGRGLVTAAVVAVVGLLLLSSSVCVEAFMQQHPFHHRHRARPAPTTRHRQVLYGEAPPSSPPSPSEAAAAAPAAPDAAVPPAAPAAFSTTEPPAPASASTASFTSVSSFLAGWTPVLPDLSSLGGGVIGSAAAEANSTLIGLLQVAQAAMNPRSVTRTFSRQFSKRYLSKWNDKTGLKEMVEQTLADLVRVADTIDVHSNPKVAAFATRVRAQLDALRRDHEAKVIFFFNEAPETIGEIPIAPAFPFAAGRYGADDEEDEEDEDEEDDGEGRSSLFGPRRVPAAGAVKKKQEFVRLFKNLLTLAKQTDPALEEDMSWFEAPSGEATTVAIGPAASSTGPGTPGSSSSSYWYDRPSSGQSGVDRLLQQVRRRMENKAAEERKSEEAVVKAGLRLEFERWQLLEATRYLSETLSKTRDLILGAAAAGSGAAAVNASQEVLRMVPPPLRSLFQDFESTLAKGALPLPVKLDFNALTSVMSTVTIKHRPEDFPQRDWRKSVDLLASQAPLPDPLLDELNHPLFLHSALLVATTPYNVELIPEAETDPALLQRTALAASKALGVAPQRLRVRHIVSDKACAVMIVVPDRRTTYVTFRGTKDPVDVLTDINFLSATFTPLGWDEEEDDDDLADQGEGGSAAGFLPFIDPHAAQGQLQLMTGTDDGTGALKVHGGFKLAFDSIKDKVTELLDYYGCTDNVVFVGHSMGGALAQLATVYYCELKARLVTFASPAIGNGAFCRLLDCCGQPYGGLRVWNDFDVVPSIAQLVGYKHAGVPIKLDVSKSAKELFEAENVNSLKGLIDFLAPHVMFQLGSVCFVFPVIGWDLQSGASTAFKQREREALLAAAEAEAQAQAQAQGQGQDQGQQQEQPVLQPAAVAVETGALGGSS